MQEVSQEYIEGIKEGREWITKYPDQDPAEMLDQLKRAKKGFASNSPVGQMLLGEIDFWKNQQKKAKT
jgi:hypothetical protein